MTCEFVKINPSQRQIIVILYVPLRHLDDLPLPTVLEAKNLHLFTAGVSEQLLLSAITDHYSELLLLSGPIIKFPVYF